MISLAYPRQTVLITCREESESFGKKSMKDNIFALDWHMPLSFSPELFGISVGKERFSVELIRSSKVFCINYMPAILKDQILFCGRNSGRHMDKFSRTGLTKVECDKIDCCRIKEALSYIECEVLQEIDVGDHILFVGKVVFSKHNLDGKSLFHIRKDEFTTTVD